MPNSTEILSNWASKFKYEDLSGTDVNYTRRLIIDYFAASFAGLKINKKFNDAIESIIIDCRFDGKSNVFGTDNCVSAIEAAFLNACYAHGADMDDGHKRAMGHVGAHVISSVFALAQTVNVTEKQVMEAIVVGYEIYCRVSAAAQPGLVHRGFHSTGTAGAIACAAACAKLLGLSQEEIYNAMAISVTQASGLIIVAESGQAIKPINPANAARAGIISALLSQKGVQGAINPLESKKVWFHAMTNEVDEEAITKDLGEKFAVSECYFKPYPSCRHTHCGIEAAIEIHNQIRDENIKKVNVYIYENAIRIAGQILIPQTDDDTKFSIHYSVAYSLLKGSFGISSINTNVITPEIVSLIEKIELIPTPEMENKDKGIRGSKLEVITDKNTYTKTIYIPKGDPEVPFTLDDLRIKLSDCASGYINIEEQSELINKVMSFGKDTPFSYTDIIEVFR